MRYGYARVSTKEQETHAQLDALQRSGVDEIFEEKRSGGDRRRPVLHALLDQLQAGDVLVVYKLDRLARSLRDLLYILDRIHLVGAEFVSLTEMIDTRSPAGRMILQILGAFAEFERELIRERTRVGMAAAMARGTVVGRPRAIVDDQAVQQAYASGMTRSAIARQYGCHLSSVKRALTRSANDGVVDRMERPGSAGTLRAVISKGNR